MSVLVGRKAPDFTCPAVLGDGKIVDDFKFLEDTKGKYRIVFFYPLDFTFVCPSELIALDHRMDQFKERNVEVVAVSIDSHFTHNAWRNTPVDKGGIGHVKFTMAADINHQIVRDYGVEAPDGSVAFRGVFLIDKDGKVMSQTVNDDPIGRNIDEIIRTVDALQFWEENGDVCPAGWQKGDAGMKANPEGVADYLAKSADKL
ncbi:MAG: peroxiredoxin [Gammaproteobacteria bacterium]|nr:peroxiredoxin [Gammaproteobacteria bacterium]